MNPVAVVGAGWAGLAAASRLASTGKTVHLFEMAPQLGGRARNTPFRPSNPLSGDEELGVDNGQHLLMGAYSHTNQLIQQLAGAQGFNALFERLPMALKSVGGVQLRAARKVPAPLHLAYGLLTSRGLNLAERWQFISLIQYLKKHHWLVSQTDFPVAQLLSQAGQSRRLIEQIWRPLCLSALNTPIDSASAKVFAAILRDTLAAKREASDFLVARVPLGDTLPKLVEQQLKQGQHQIFLKTQVLALHQPRGPSGSWFIQTQSDRTNTEYAAVVLATPWFTTQALLERPQRTEMPQLPIVTAYLYWRHSSFHHRQAPLMLLDKADEQCFGQWLFDLGNTPGGGRLASVVISGPGPHTLLERQQLAQAIKKQINLQTGWLVADDCFIITEKRATFACTVNVERPSATDNLPKAIALCGDYFQSEYPATLETAVRSGLQAAQAVV